MNYEAKEYRLPNLDTIVISQIYRQEESVPSKNQTHKGKNASQISKASSHLNKKQDIHWNLNFKKDQLKLLKTCRLHRDQQSS